MKKGFFSVIILFCCGLALNSCIKNSPHITTINPSMTANIGAYNFTASSVQPATLDTQLHDTSTTLLITGYSADVNYPRNKIVLSVTNYKGLTGVYSIVRGDAGAYMFYGSAPADTALGGIVAITRITSNTITGYFNFNTIAGFTITNGLFTVGTP